ncbi:hypothetical protein FRC19_008163, partial [Serendipita sp. 401]
HHHHPQPVFSRPRSQQRHHTIFLSNLRSRIHRLGVQQPSLQPLCPLNTLLLLRPLHHHYRHHFTRQPFQSNSNSNNITVSIVDPIPLLHPGIDNHNHNRNYQF